MNKFSIKHKIVALMLALAFIFQSMESINSHTYKIGVDSYHYFNSCFGGSFPSHLASKCVDGCNSLF